MLRAAYNRPASLVDLRNKSATPIQRTSWVGMWAKTWAPKGWVSKTSVPKTSPAQGALIRTDFTPSFLFFLLLVEIYIASIAHLLRLAKAYRVPLSIDFWRRRMALFVGFKHFQKLGQCPKIFWSPRGI